MLPDFLSKLFPIKKILSHFCTKLKQFAIKIIVKLLTTVHFNIFKKI